MCLCQWLTLGASGLTFHWLSCRFRICSAFCSHFVQLFWASRKASRALRGEGLLGLAVRGWQSQPCWVALVLLPLSLPFSDLTLSGWSRQQPCCVWGSCLELWFPGKAKHCVRVWGWAGGRVWCLCHRLWLLQTSHWDKSCCCCCCRRAELCLSHSASLGWVTACAQPHACHFTPSRTHGSSYFGSVCSSCPSQPPVQNSGKGGARCGKGQWMAEVSSDFTWFGLPCVGLWAMAESQQRNVIWIWIKSQTWIPAYVRAQVPLGTDC